MFNETQSEMLLKHALATKKRILEIESYVVKSNFCIQYVVGVCGHEMFVYDGKGKVAFDGSIVIAKGNGTWWYISLDERILLDQQAREYLRKLIEESNEQQV